MIYILTILVVILIALVSYNIHSSRNSSSDTYSIGRVIQELEVINKSILAADSNISTISKSLPKSVLHTIQSSINPRKGKLGELVTLLRLNSEYDRLIPLGQPVDMIGISNDHIDFIEIKENKSRLTSMEKHIKELVDAGSVRFVICNTTTDIVVDAIECGEEE